jgi:hypothetical protein
MSILTQIGDSGTTKDLASGAATAAIFAAYVRFGMGRPEIFTAPMLKYFGVVGASSVASSFVWHQINTGPIEDQSLVYGLTGESFLQAASTAAVSSMMYRSAFGVPPNMQSLAVVAACDLGGQVSGPYLAKMMTLQTV